MCISSDIYFIGTNVDLKGDLRNIIIVDQAKRIHKESQEMARIAASTAEACTDETLKQESFV